jgi:RsiW-degrading membrane proteinase PrsW (M82 family)
MDVLAVMSLAIAPGLFWLWFFYKRDRFEPEPKHLIARTFFLGILVAFPIVFAQAFFLFLPAFILYAVIAPVTEEYGKFVVVRYGIYNHAEFDEPIDGIIYGVSAALGFATIENIGYLLGSYFSPEEALGEGASASDAVLFLFIARSLLSVPGHAIWASFWGYALGRAKFALSPERGKKLILNGLMLAIVSHGLFNGLLLLHPALALGALVVIVIGWQMTFRRISAARAASPHASRSVNDRPKD